MKRYLSDALWIAGGSAVTALGTLFGVRILTQFLSPGAYGVVSLALGMSALAISLVATPLTQAAIHYYPEMSANGSARDLLDALRRCFLRMAPWILAAAVVCGTVYVRWGGGSALLVVILALLFASDCWRSANVSLLNAARQNRRYALWLTSDTWARPLVASAVVAFAGQSSIAVLGSYVLVSVTLLILFSRRLWPPDAFGANSRAGSTHSAATLDTRIWSYALPLIPMGTIGWASNLGDRYVIGGILSVADAGLYAAAYGLSSAPFMLVGGTVELALRPVHQAAVASGNHRRAQELFRLWIAAVAIPCGIGVLIFATAHHLLAAIFVGEAFRSGSDLMPWIGAGYAIRATAYVFERICYAYGETRRVLTIQLCAVAATAIATPLGVLSMGLKGAAMAVPVYFSIQLIAAMWFAKQTLQKATLAVPSVGVEHATVSRA